MPVLALLLAHQFAAATFLAPFLDAMPANQATASSAATAKARPKPAALIDINHATLDRIKTLPGIQDAMAAKIIRNRPYANKTQLSTKGVMSAATYARIRALIIAKQ